MCRQYGRACANTGGAVRISSLDRKIIAVPRSMCHEHGRIATGSIVSNISNTLELARLIQNAARHGRAWNTGGVCTAASNDSGIGGYHSL
jgi:hypothetical protein